MPETFTEPDIRRMVESFYARVQRDPLLGPVFETRVAGRWPAHLDRMVDFWSSALVGAGRYSGNPRAVHRSIAALDGHHFERWLVLFEDTVSELFDPNTAAWVADRSQAMARSLQRGIPRSPPKFTATEAEGHDHA